MTMNELPELLLSAEEVMADSVKGKVGRSSAI